MKSLALSTLFFALFIVKSDNRSLTTYSFNQKITMTTTSSSNDTVDVDYFFNSKDSNSLCMRMSANMEMGSSEAVYFVFKDDKIEMLMNAGGMKIRKTISAEEFSAYSTQQDIPEQSDISKTGNTKTILGYSCDEYKVVTNEGSFTAWVCSNFPIDNSFIPMLGMRADSPFDGFVMELQTTASNEIAHLKITEVDLNANLVIDTSGYKNFKF